MNPNLIKRIQLFSFQNKLWGKGSKIVLGISGGPDSVCLLDILSRLAPKYSFQIHLAHVNYGLRGKDSLKDEALIEKLGEKYGFPVTILAAPPISGPNLENKLRDLRYSFFEELRQNIGFDLIAVAHTLDDQAETFLMRLLRGSGSKGLSSMSPRSDRIIRPLLSTSKEEVLTHNLFHGLSFRIDSSNKDSAFTRNRIRHKLIPALKRDFNPNIVRTLAENASLLHDDEHFLAQMAQAYFRKGYSRSAKKLLSLHPALQKRVLLEAIRAHRGDLKDLTHPNVREILKALESPKGKNQRVTLKRLILVRKGDRVILL